MASTASAPTEPEVSVIENREPRIAEVSGLPHAAVYRRHVKNIGLAEERR